jgi:hypothetical protein
MKQVLFFHKKPKYKIGDIIKEAVVDNSYYKFYTPLVVYKITKYKLRNYRYQYQVHLQDEIDKK